VNQDRLQELWATSQEALSTSAVEALGASMLRYVLRQSFEYQYASPVFSLVQSLKVVPPAEYGGQRRMFHQLSVLPGGSQPKWSRDAFENTVAHVRIPYVGASIEFTIDAVVERQVQSPPVRLPATALREPRYLEATALTASDERLLEAARTAAGASRSVVETARRIWELVHTSVRYQKGVTGVDTTAGEAFALGAGVCQDQAHVMLAMCRSLQVPCRYVSGHMLGEGSTHAWVEVLVPDPGDETLAIGLPFDPCHLREPDLNYLTVAIGRDYADVTPVSGTYTGSSANRLISSTRLGVALA